MVAFSSLEISVYAYYHQNGSKAQYFNLVLHSAPHNALQSFPYLVFSFCVGPLSESSNFRPFMVVRTLVILPLFTSWLYWFYVSLFLWAILFTHSRNDSISNEYFTIFLLFHSLSFFSLSLCWANLLNLIILFFAFVVCDF